MLPKVGFKFTPWHLFVVMIVVGVIGVPFSILWLVSAILSQDGANAGASVVLIIATGICAGCAVAWGSSTDAPRKPDRPARLGRHGRKQARRVRKAEQEVNARRLEERADLMLTQKVIDPEDGAALPPPDIPTQRDRRWQ